MYEEVLAVAFLGTQGSNPSCRSPVVFVFLSILNAQMLRYGFSFVLHGTIISFSCVDVFKNGPQIL